MSRGWFATGAVSSDSWSGHELQLGIGRGQRLAARAGSGVTARAFVAIVLAVVMTGATTHAPTAAAHPDPSVSTVQTAVPIGAVPCPLGAPAGSGCLAASACCVTTPLPAQASPAPWSAAADAMIYPVLRALTPQPSPIPEPPPPRA